MQVQITFIFGIRYSKYGTMQIWLFQKVVTPPTITTSRPISYALANYPLLAQRHAILVALHRESGNILEGICVAKYNIGNLVEPLERCAKHVFRECLKDGVDVNPQGNDDEEEERDELDDLNRRHHGLYSTGMSADAIEILPSTQKWHIR